jgi:hypothetical protein
MRKERQKHGAVRLDHNEIAELAYKFWCAAGRPATRDLEFWLQAEPELLTARRWRSPNTDASAQQPRSAKQERG